MSMSSLETRMESISSDSSPRCASFEVSTEDHSVAAPGVGVVFIISLEGLLPADPPAKEARLDLHSCARLALEGDRLTGVGEIRLECAGEVGDDTMVCCARVGAWEPRIFRYLMNSEI